MTLLDKAREEINECDRALAALFERRMAAVEQVAAYKREAGLPVLDSAREAEVLQRNLALLQNPDLAREYTVFQKGVMAASRAYQRRLLSDLYVETAEGGYPIVLCRGVLARAGEELDLDRRVLVVTDSGVPAVYANTVLSACKNGVLAVVPQGEASKNLANFSRLLNIMAEGGFTRRDCVVAVGGGVVGDLAAFAASAYMRGIDFYNVPTTMLSQVDSSIGGKCGVDFEGYKNMVGAFKQPSKVLIDPDVLSTLAPRQMAAGYAEIIKMAATHSPELFSLLEREGKDAPLEEVISAALRIKRQVVMEDEKESGVRRVLNFGHTLGHGIESRAAGTLLHGECVALGMLPLCAPAVRARLVALYERFGLPTRIPYTPDEVWGAILHDKKMAGDRLTYVWVEEVGTFELRTVTPREFYETLKGEAR